MNENHDREYREEVALRVRGSLIFLPGVIVTLLFLDMGATILAKTGMFGAPLLVILGFVHYRWILPIMRDGRMKLREARSIRARRKARLPRK